MKVYLASWFASKDQMAQRVAELEKEGIDTTCRWVYESTEPTASQNDHSDVFNRTTGSLDICDIIEANIVVLHTPSDEDLKLDMPVGNWARGGRHFEAGFQYALMMFLQWLPTRIPSPRDLIIVGRKENVFHYLDDKSSNGSIYAVELPGIKVFPTWEEAKQHLIEVKDAYKYASASARS